MTNENNVSRNDFNTAEESLRPMYPMIWKPGLEDLGQPESRRHQFYLHLLSTTSRWWNLQNWMFQQNWPSMRACSVVNLYKASFSLGMLVHSIRIGTFVSVYLTEFCKVKTLAKEVLISSFQHYNVNVRFNR